MTLTQLIPEGCLAYVHGSGSDLLERVGSNEIRRIVAGVLCGENVRTATEPLTRRRLAVLNAGILVTLVRASEKLSPETLLEEAKSEYRSLAATDPRRRILMWIVGLTTKQVQNVLRSDDDAWTAYVQAAFRVTEDVASYSEEEYGKLDLEIKLSDRSVQWNWLWAHALMIPVGAQTLATRGSEKSMYGKFFEKLVMGSVLSILGFEMDEDRVGKDMTYWLSERGDKRESDATAVVREGLGVRFDIGFIGPGNTEISLDKVSRFERTAELAERQLDLGTVILVDRIGQGSRIVELAELIDGKIVQMSSSMWVKEVDEIFSERCEGYRRALSEDATVDDVRELAAKSLVDRRIVELLREAKA